MPSCLDFSRGHSPTPRRGRIDSTAAVSRRGITELRTGSRQQLRGGRAGVRWRPDVLRNVPRDEALTVTRPPPTAPLRSGGRWLP